MPEAATAGWGLLFRIRERITRRGRDMRSQGRVKSFGAMALAIVVVSILGAPSAATADTHREYTSWTGSGNFASGQNRDIDVGSDGRVYIANENGLYSFSARGAAL